MYSYECTFPLGIKNMKQTIQSWFLHCVVPYLSSGILSPADFGTTIKSLHTKDVSIFKSLLSHNRVLQTASPQIALEDANLPRQYRTTLSQLCSSFSSRLHSYRERIGLIPSLLCPSCGMEPHTTVHAFSCSSHPALLTVRAWRRSSCRSFISSTSRLLLLLPLSPFLLADKRVRGNYHY